MPVTQWRSWLPDWAAHSCAAGQPPIAEMVGDMPAQPVSAIRRLTHRSKDGGRLHSMNHWRGQAAWAEFRGRDSFQVSNGELGGAAGNTGSTPSWRRTVTKSASTRISAMSPSVNL